jgi:hypothetical protein
MELLLNLQSREEKNETTPYIHDDYHSGARAEHVAAGGLSCPAMEEKGEEGRKR